MRHIRLLAMLVLPTTLAGCHLPGRDGPVSQSLATCRQLSQQGVAALERGQHEQAEKLLSKAVKACPADPEARRHYAEALWQRGDRTNAVAQLEQAARQSGDDAALHVRLAEMHLAMSRPDAARQSAEQAVQRNPRLAAAWIVRGQVLRAAGDTQQALADCQRALLFASDDRRALLEIAELQRQLNQPERALQTLQCLADTYTPRRGIAAGAAPDGHGVHGPWPLRRRDGEPLVRSDARDGDRRSLLLPGRGPTARRTSGRSIRLGATGVGARAQASAKYRIARARRDCPREYAAVSVGGTQLDAVGGRR